MWHEFMVVQGLSNNDAKRLRLQLMHDAPKAKVVRPRGLRCDIRVKVYDSAQAERVATRLTGWEVDFKHTMYG